MTVICTALQKLAGKEDAPNYRPAKDMGTSCSTCKFWRPKGEGLGYCDAYEFACRADYVCDAWTSSGKEKKSADERTLDKALTIAPGAASIGGAAWGVSSPHAFKPGALFGKKIVPKVTGVRGRVASGLLGASLMGGLASVPKHVRESYLALRPKQKQEIPLLIKKQASAGRDLAHYFWDELEQIGRRVHG